MVESALFYVFAVFTLMGAVVVVSHKNPVVSVISFVFTLFSTAVLFVLLYAHFIAAVQVLVYAGAIIVLFLFTITFLNIREKELGFDAKSIPKKLTFLTIIASAAGYCAYRISVSAFKGKQLARPSLDFGTVESVGKSMFLEYIVPLELAAILLLAAIIGVVVIAKKGEF